MSESVNEFPNEFEINKDDELLSPKTSYFLNIMPDAKEPLPENIGVVLAGIQNDFPEFSLWVIIQNGDDDKYLGDLGEDLWKEMYEVKKDIETDKEILLLCISPGGEAEAAYRIAKLFKDTTHGYTMIIPNQAKSAATLLSLGANKIILGRNADLGPLDVQIGDSNEERVYSGLDEVQAIDGLFDFANSQIIQTTMLWSRIMRKKKQVIFPAAIEYVTGMMKPLMEKIDTVHYMSLSRTLRIAEEYAYRLLLPKYGPYAKVIAQKFVQNYPNHGFIIDYEECKSIGLKNVKLLEIDIQEKCDKLLSLTKDCSNFLIGKFTQITS